MRCLVLLAFFLVVTRSGLAQAPYRSPARSEVDSSLAPFYHGVASGDPMADRVILWTRITTDQPTASVRWQVSTDTLFSNIALSGTTQTDSSKDYTVKVDAIGLQPDRWYYFRFRADSVWSIPGRTRTAPNTAVPNLRFGVVSCSNYQDGYFNAYRDLAVKNDVDAIVHLGDYIYEYGINDFSPGVDSSRLHDPETEVLSLNEYRVRHSQYKLDPDLRELHRQLPFIAIWDDHETANDAWRGGAANHTPATEGPWETRKEAGRKAYFEWMPIRDVHASIDTIHRFLDWGGLAQFILLDTRLEGRQEQIGVSGPAVTDTNRTLLGRPQWQWFRSRLSAANAQWKLIGNQVMISPLRFLGTPVNQDQWDGYPAERARVLGHIQNNRIGNTVFLTGDIHSSWANDVPLNLSSYNATTGAGSTAVEFVCTSVTSSNIVGNAIPPAAIYLSNPNIKFTELTKHGYLLLDLTPQRAQGDWIHLSSVTDRVYSAAVGASYRTDNGTNRLYRAPGALSPRTGRPAPAPKPLVTASRPRQSLITTLYCRPNPATDRLTLQYYARSAAPVQAAFVDGKGRVVQILDLPFNSIGLHEIELPLQSLARGVYMLRLTGGGEPVERRFIKN